MEILLKVLLSLIESFGGSNFGKDLSSAISREELVFSGEAYRNFIQSIKSTINPRLQK